jgi:hypothetical protein
MLAGWLSSLKNEYEALRGLLMVSRTVSLPGCWQQRNPRTRVDPTSGIPQPNGPISGSRKEKFGHAPQTVAVKEEHNSVNSSLSLHTVSWSYLSPPPKVTLPTFGRTDAIRCGTVLLWARLLICRAPWRHGCRPLATVASPRSGLLCPLAAHDS